MGREKIKSVTTSFTAEGDYLAILSSNGVVKIWNTDNRKLLAEWKDPNVDSVVGYSCMACSFIGKKHKKERQTLLLALGTHSGDVIAININTGEGKWASVACHPGGTTALSFANNNHTLYTAGADGMVSELDSKSGEIIGKFKASKKSITSLSLSYDKELLAVASAKIRVFSLENKKELHKFSANSGPVQPIAVSDGGKAVVTSAVDEKQLCVWVCDQGKRIATASAALYMQKPPVVLECRNSCKDEEGLIILSVSEAGIAYIWSLMNLSQDEVTPTRIIVKSLKTETEQIKSSKKNRIPIIAARLHGIEKDGRVLVLITYGSITCPQFTLLEVPDPGEDIYITASDEMLVPETITGSPQTEDDSGIIAKTGMGPHKSELELIDAPSQEKRVKKRRLASNLDLSNEDNSIDAGHLEVLDGLDHDVNELTMGEKLASLNILDDDKSKSPTKQEVSSDTKLPSADSVYVLVKQALHADDRALLLDCLYTQDEKVIANSTALLNPSDVLKLLNSLIRMIQLRGAVLVCAIPWLRSLLLQHSSGIMSQGSSLLALNSLYQLIESRTSTYGSALQLSCCMDYLFAGIADDVPDEDTSPPVVYEDVDDSDEEPKDAMETDEEDEEFKSIDPHFGSEASDGMDN